MASSFILSYWAFASLTLRWKISRVSAPSKFAHLASTIKPELRSDERLLHIAQGICVDPFPKNFEKRTCNLHRRAVASSKRNVTFVIADVLSGITDHLDTFKEATKDSDRVVLETALLHDLLEESNAPPFIDYFSLDTEGSEKDILESFPFWKYTFGLISVEHNFEEPKRSQIRSILKRNGYRLHKKVEFDDWYMKEMYIPAFPKAHESKHSIEK